jgi:hemerythrin-like domain-containing protein
VSESKFSPLARDLRLVHRVITRGLNISGESCKALTERGFPEASTQDGFLNYVTAFTSLLDAHHTTEDELVFPQLRSKSLEAPYDALMGQHREMVTLLREVEARVEEMRSNRNATEPMEKLRPTLASIAEIWHPHIQVEEDYFTADRLFAVMGLDEQGVLSRKAAEHSQKQATPDYLVAPFLLFNLTQDDRAVFAQAMPPIVTQQLVPIAWKDKWQSMKPFLLA